MQHVTYYYNLLLLLLLSTLTIFLYKICAVLTEEIFERLKGRHPFINMTIRNLFYYTHARRYVFDWPYEFNNALLYRRTCWRYDVIRLETRSSITLSADISLGEPFLIRNRPSVAPVHSISVFNGSPLYFSPRPYLSFSLTSKLILSFDVTHPSILLERIMRILCAPMCREIWDSSRYTSRFSRWDIRNRSEK